ncbi:DUF1700 domain-containing protein [Streptococcus sobrinus]|uniref:DUF1700 domain-containing protein n=2 Tax=Streptococcus sobrinus TaxID=1310 RepID=U2IXQ8_9STRE|nr:DUF1700 domain-containing protein [Streptococcus sobrinus]AWN19782.1 DUF1700 domain-containing protein [Streptococcus sobrinus]ERJ78756.1 hypothetical protein HMPREF1557_00227 [Streptococcus sobrinus W1703]
MTRNDYLQELDKHLKKLPQQDYREAMDYFTEYFDEAGPENETQVIQELGSPKEAAKEIIHNILDGKSDHSEKNSKSRLALIWIAILACLFNPFGWALIAIIFSLLVVGVAMIFTLFMLGIAGAISGIAIFIDGLSYLGSTWAGGLIGIGIGLVFAGLACLFVLATTEASRWIGRGIVAIARWASRKGKRS